MAQKKPGKNEKSVGQSLSKKTSVEKWVPVLIFLVSFLTYSGTLKYNYTLDDGRYTFKNIFVKKGISSFPDLVFKGSQVGSPEYFRPDYRPVVLIDFALEQSLFGNSPKTNHFTNVFFFDLLCALLFGFLRKVFRDYPLYVPLLITALFALHPIHTEVVANIKSRDELLCLLFGVLSLNYILDYQRKGETRYLVYSCISFFLSILCKETGYAFLVLIPLVLYFFSYASLKKILLNTLPFLGIIGIAVLMRIHAIGIGNYGKPLMLMENSLVAATNVMERLATAFEILFHALYLLFFPVTLSWDYSFNQFPVVQWSNGVAVASLLIHLGLVVVAVMGLKKKTIFSFAIWFYLLTSFITSNLVILIGWTFGERFLFTPSLAFCIVLPFLLALIFRIDLKKTVLNKAAKVVGILTVILLLYAFKTTDRNQVWANEEKLFESGIETSPNSSRTHSAYGDWCSTKAQSNVSPEERMELTKIALSEYQKAIDINPNLKDVYFNMGTLLYNIMGDTIKAVQMYKKVLELEPADIGALTNYSVLLLDKKEYNNSLALFLKATEIKAVNPYPNIYTGAGICYEGLNDYSKAITYYKKALELDPSNQLAIQKITGAYLHTGDTAMARYYNNQLIPR